MGITDKESKKTKINEIISNRIGDINDIYRKGPSLYFYRRLKSLRDETNNIEEFIKVKYNLEIIYATLVAWDMDSRGAKMECFDKFRGNLISCLNHFVQLEEYNNNDNPYINSDEIIDLLATAYKR